MTRESVLDAFNPRGYTGLTSLSERLGSTPEEVWPHVKRLFLRGQVVRVKKGCFVRRARPSLKIMKRGLPPIEARILAGFTIEEPRGYWQIMLDMGRINKHDERNRGKTPRTNGKDLTRLIRRGMIFRLRKGMYALTQFGLDYLTKGTT